MAYFPASLQEEETVIGALNVSCFAKTFYLTKITLVIQIDFKLKNFFSNIFTFY
jgi:hypothetical protein